MPVCVIRQTYLVCDLKNVYVCFLSKLCDIQLNFKFLKKHFSLANLILNGDKRCLKEEKKSLLATI